MTQQKVYLGARVKVATPHSPEFGRTAKVIGEALPQGGKQWLVAFEYPLGGVVGRAILQADEMQVIPRL